MRPVKRYGVFSLTLVILVSVMSWVLSQHVEPIMVAQDFAMTCFFLAQVLGRWSQLKDTERQWLGTVSRWASIGVAACVGLTVLTWLATD